MKLIKVTPNNGRGTDSIYINATEILRIDYGNSEHNHGCEITFKNGQVLQVYDKAKRIADSINSAGNPPE